jgi:hypothetical protein
VKLDHCNNLGLGLVSVTDEAIFELADQGVLVVSGEMGGDVWFIGKFHVGGLAFYWPHLLFLGLALMLASW